MLQESFPIGLHENAGELHDKMKDIGAHLLLQTIKGIADGSLKEMPQELLSDNTTLNHAPKIHTDHCRINWSLPVEAVYNLIRGLSPYPGAFMIMNEKMFKIYSAEKEMVFPSVTEGDYETDGKAFLKFACSNGYLHLKEVQMEGKKKMKIEDFLRGFRFEGNV